MGTRVKTCEACARWSSQYSHCKAMTNPNVPTSVKWLIGTHLDEKKPGSYYRLTDCHGFKPVENAEA